jgi:hypothetical protein
MNVLPAIFKSMDFEYSDHTRFGGIRAVKYIGNGKLQLDVLIESVEDKNNGQTYSIPEDSFRKKVPVQVTPLKGGIGVNAYALPLGDLLVTKFIASRDQDMADIIVLVLADPAPDAIADFKNKVRLARLSNCVNLRLGEMLGLSESDLQRLMSEYTGGRLTVTEIRTLHRRLRQLRI